MGATLQFIITDVFMLAVGAVFYLMVRALPRIEEEPYPAEKKNFLDRLAHSDIPEKIDVAFGIFLLKLLRKAKILILKIDNGISKALRGIKPDGQSANPAIDFKEMMEQKKDEK